MARQTGSSGINNSFYDELLDDWYTANDHPIALLRAENLVRNPWICEEIRKKYNSPVSILDIGCGAGLLTNTLAKEGHIVSGIDLSPHSLEMARKTDQTQTVHYQKANAYSLPFQDQCFDVVCAMDILEHVEHPEILIQEAARVLKKGGLFFFHTFNRNFLSYLIIIKGVEWFVRNAPKDMHVYSLFIQPSEIKQLCLSHDLEVTNWIGLRPKINKSLFQMLLTRVVPSDFSFSFSKSLSTGYCGIAHKYR
jgi:2-polyprenyl-6-hydroxyphenyl methylase/3-demethylubiquinone-9 3-methyltransferase